jgi:hypothetical protein
MAKDNLDVMDTNEYVYNITFPDDRIKNSFRNTVAYLINIRKYNMFKIIFI